MLLNKEDLEVMLTTAGKTRHPKRDTMILKFLYYTGCRIGELVEIKVGQVRNADRIHLTAGQTKRRHPRTVFLNRALQEELAIYIASKSDDDALFPSQKGAQFSKQGLTNMMSKLCKASGIDDVTSHSFRRSYITRLGIDRNVPVKVLQELVGHRQLTTTQLYLEVTDMQLQSAVEAA